eukprot:SAG31_NODE_169_length_21415_cov_29.765338_9_plen_67_part_00
MYMYRTRSSPIQSIFFLKKINQSQYLLSNVAMMSTVCNVIVLILIAVMDPTVPSYCTSRYRNIHGT